MDQKKIGLFIMECRKRKKLTQAELGEKLGVTEKSISNWENGRNMPDLSLFKPLCDIFNISVNELLSGEKISKNNMISSSDKTIINTLNENIKNKKKSNSIIGTLLFILIMFVIIFLIFIFNVNIYKKINIYSIVVSLEDDIYTLNKKFEYEENKDVYYYGIDEAMICDLDENCHDLKVAFSYNQIDVETLRKYLDSQYGLGNINNYKLYDGGTSIYENDRYSVIFCNTLDNNKDIYIGKSGMIEELDGNYCGHEKSSIVKFIRTYHIMKVEEIDNDLDFVNVTLKGKNDEIAIVKVNNRNDLVVGKNYEFTFYTYNYFKENISNIFKYSTLLMVKETDKLDFEQVNEEIYVNKFLDNGSSLNDVDDVYLEIEEGSLTNYGATIIITDYSRGKYIYGSPFRVDEYKNGTWSEVKNICDNCAFNAMAYGPDINGKLRFSHYWEHMYGKLKPGKYRLVKDILLNGSYPVSYEDRIYVSVEFEIK